MHIVRHRKYPNNEIRSVHYYRAPPRLLSTNESEGVVLCDTPKTASDSEEDSSEASVPTLDISSEVLQRTACPPRKRTKFGLAAKNTLLRAGGALDTICSKPHYYVMLTGTLPGGTPEAMQCIADWSHYIVDSIGKWLKRTHPSEYWFYVWELQERGALHIHWCVYLPDTYQRCCLLWAWWDKWRAILAHIQKKSGVDLWRRKDGSHHKKGNSVLQADAQTVYRSVAAYLAGYCSNDKNKHSRDAHCPYYPSRWWGYSRPLKRLLDSLTETITVEHTNYRDARYEIQAHYERVLHDSPKAYHYSHKVGIGSTVVSYHPQGKGTEIWQGLKPMNYRTETHPNTCFMIALMRSTILETQSFLEALKKPPKSYSALQYSKLKGLVFPGILYGYSLSRRDMGLLLEIPCELNSDFTALQPPERLRKRLILLQVAFLKYLPEMRWDKHGYLCSERDLPGTVDTNYFVTQDSTIHPTGSDAVEGGENGSISPQPPFYKQLELPCLSPPTERL